MMYAPWNGTVLAEAERTVVVEGDPRFPPDSPHHGCSPGSRTGALRFGEALARHCTVTAVAFEEVAPQESR
ncbi:hypothetical protein [Streptomyces sp. 891-h]|uniref:hypothetical protein n=1 Tax=unclassified Streptomyces TaxID=2593676 RepID=UPI001FA9C6FB|nr:hypothetical protein [Streptomyces sp. 891-h]